MNRITVSWLLFGDRLKGGKAGLEVLADHAVHAEKMPISFETKLAGPYMAR